MSLLPSSLSYQPHVSRRRSSLASTTSNGSSGINGNVLAPINTAAPADDAHLLGLASPSSQSPGSPPSFSPSALLYSPGAATASASAIDYTYVCNKCGFGTELLSVYMPHTAYPCGEQPMENNWGKL
ncbi:hypothetical protein GGI11_001930 [Coemansia sp. RSA 2049]|nr:hypothetical protein GGI11_001930 [Coemansia sp. RSA 2049]KAJ2615029.1 hypothetical protein EV177_001772 [Coemansia sp. RSA 1804]